MNILEDFQWRLTIAEDPSKKETQTNILEATPAEYSQAQNNQLHDQKVEQATPSANIVEAPESKAQKPEAPKIIFKTSTRRSRIKEAEEAEPKDSNADPTQAKETSTVNKPKKPAASKSTPKGLPKKSSATQKKPKPSKKKS